MERAVLGLVLDSSVLIAAERAKLTAPEAVKSVRAAGVRMKPSEMGRKRWLPGQFFTPSDLTLSRAECAHTAPLLSRLRSWKPGSWEATYRLAWLDSRNQRAALQDENTVDQNVLHAFRILSGILKGGFVLYTGGIEDSDVSVGSRLDAALLPHGGNVLI
jgi:hypothetical protein